MDDSALIARCQRGDSDAFDALAARHQDRLHRLARRLVGDREDARDAVQEILLRLHRALPGFRGQARFTTWLYRLAANACADLLRRRRPVATVALDPDLDRAGSSADPEIQCEEGFREHLLNQALKELPAQQRLVLVLRDVEGLSNQEAAAVLGIDSGTLKSRLHRARGALRRVLESGVTVAGMERVGRFRLTGTGHIT